MGSGSDIYLSNIFDRGLVKRWKEDGGVKFYLIETTAKLPKQLQGKITKFNSKIKLLKNEAYSNSDIVTILINSINVPKNTIPHIKQNGSWRVDYLLATKINDENNGHYHNLGGQKFENHMFDHLTNIANDLKIDEYVLEKRVNSKVGDMDLLFITNKSQAKLEKKIIKCLKDSESFKVYGDKVK